jgi:predicted dehydrogenase
MTVMYKIKRPVLAGQDGWKAMRMVEAIYRSAQSDRSVKL